MPSRPALPLAVQFRSGKLGRADRIGLAGETNRKPDATLKPFYRGCQPNPVADPEGLGHERNAPCLRVQGMVGEGGGGGGHEAG